MAEHKLTHLKRTIEPYEGILPSEIILNIKTEPVLAEFWVSQFDEWVYKARFNGFVINLSKLSDFVKAAKTEKTKRARAILVSYLIFIAAEYSTGQYFWSCENPIILNVLGVSSKTLNTMLNELANMGGVLREKVIRDGNKKVYHEIPDFDLKSPDEQKKLCKRLMNFYRFYYAKETESPAFSTKDAEEFSKALHKIRDFVVSTIVDLFKIWGDAKIWTAPCQIYHDGNPNPDKFVKTPYLTGADGYFATNMTRALYNEQRYWDKISGFEAIMDRGNDFIEDKYYIGGVGFWIKSGLVVLDADDWQTKEDIWLMLEKLEIKTSIVRTPRGGCHFYFRANKEVIACLQKYAQLYKHHVKHNRNKTKRNAGLDILANEHFVTLAGTATPSGKWYEVVSQHAPATLTKKMIFKMFNMTGTYNTSKDVLNMESIRNTMVVERARAEGRAAEVAIYEATYGKSSHPDDAMQYFYGKATQSTQAGAISIIDRARKNHGIINDGNRHNEMTTIGSWFSHMNYPASVFKQINHELCNPPLPDYDIEQMIRYHRLS